MGGTPLARGREDFDKLYPDELKAAQHSQMRNGV
jgi:hypothetical protein